MSLRLITWLPYASICYNRDMIPWRSQCWRPTLVKCLWSKEYTKIQIRRPYFFIVKLCPQKIQEISDDQLQIVHVTVVDNFQGEENKIILLSLVRSNSEGRIGFLATENRVCVALSRARDGFFIVGNMDILAATNPTWIAVKKALEKQGAIGPAIPLRWDK